MKARTPRRSVAANRASRSPAVELKTRPSAVSIRTGPRSSSARRRYQTTSLPFTGYRGGSQVGWDKLTNFRDHAVYLMDNGEDAAAVARCLTGERNAYEGIVARYQRVLFNVALRMLGNYEEARDATQSAFVKAYEHLDSFNPDQRFFNWIFRILKNECLNVLRSRRPTTEVSAEFPARSGEDPIESKERHRAVQAALLELSIEYREVVVLRHFTDLSYDDIATTLGIPAKTVKSRLYSARQQLGALLVDWRSSNGV